MAKEVVILKSNLQSALHVAIKKQRADEKEKLGYDRDSGIVAGWQEILNALSEGKTVKIK